MKSKTSTKLCHHHYTIYLPFYKGFMFRVNYSSNIIFFKHLSRLSGHNWMEASITSMLDWYYQQGIQVSILDNILITGIQDSTELVPQLCFCLKFRTGCWANQYPGSRLTVVQFLDALASLRSILFTNWVTKGRHLFKKTFSFGHCPNHLNPPPWPQLGQLGPFFSDVKIQDLKVTVGRGGRYINNLKNS